MILCKEIWRFDYMLDLAERQVLFNVYFSLENGSCYFQLVVKHIFKKEIYIKSVSFCKLRTLNHCITISWTEWELPALPRAGSQDPCTLSYFLPWLSLLSILALYFFVLFFNFQLYWGKIDLKIVRYFKCTL